MGRESIYWDMSGSPLGDIYAAVNQEGALILLFYAYSLGDAVELLNQRGVPIQDDGRLKPVFSQLDEYFNGRRKQFDLEVDLKGLTSFQKNVLKATRRIPYGEVAAYKSVATMIGKSGAARAVGSALGNNPVGIIIPCHRVIASGGGLGGFSGPGGLKTKQFLLALEGSG